MTNADRANTLLPFWPESAVVVARNVWQARFALEFRPAQAAVDLRNSQFWYRQAADRNPADPVAWENLALGDQQLGDARAEASAWQRALLDYPYTALALADLAKLDEQNHDWRGAVALLTRLVGVTPPNRSVERELRDDRVHL